MIRARAGAGRDRRGQSLVEFVLVVPVLLLLLLGTIEFGRLWGAKNLVITAAREGARLASLDADDATVTARVQALLDTEHLDLTSLQVTDPAGPAGMRTVTVTVTSDVSTLFGILPGLDDPTSLSSSVTMRFEESASP